MKFNTTSNRFNYVLLGLFILLGIFSFAYNQYLIDRIREKERSSIRLWAKATEHMANSSLEQSSRHLLNIAKMLEANPTVADSVVQAIRKAESERASQNFVVEEIILKDRYKIPTLIMNAKGKVLSTNHISSEIDSSFVQDFMTINPPIVIKLGEGKSAITQYIYYGESAVVRYLRYFPYIQLSLLALLLSIAYLTYRSINRSKQSNIWVGMTKEAAHQLGTPLSSLYGWIELLKEEKSDDAFITKVTNGLEGDAKRLQEVAERFNQIGSEPELEIKPIVPFINEIMDYIEERLPHIGKHVTLNRPDDEGIKAQVNPELFQWALENVLKNSMNAIQTTKDGATVSVSVKRVEERVYIDVEDTGHGIEKKYHKEIFKPGYSTKKRGWGVGLSLTKRIVEEYHGGNISVLYSKIDEGTTMRIELQTEDK